MKIYENDKGEKFVESGEVRYPKQGEWYGHPITMYPTRALLDHSQSHHRILRPATPEEIVESEDKKMCPAGCGLRYDHVRTVSAEEDECPWIQAWIHSRECNRLAPMEQARAYADAHWSEFVKKGEKPKLTLPLVVGQIVVCRDGVERTALHVKGRLAYWTQNATDPCWYKSSGLYWTQGDHGLDAISDSPRWKPEKKDEGVNSLDRWVYCCQIHGNFDVDGYKAECPKCKDEKEKQARAATSPSKAGVAVVNATPSNGHGNDLVAKPAEKPVAPPAILPEWTDGDIKQFCYDKKNQTVFKHMNDARAYVQSVLAGGPIRKSDKPKPDTRPDIEQRDASSDSFVWRRDWRVGH